MPKYQVVVEVTKKVTLDRVYARDEQSAGEKAADLAESWNMDVTDVEVLDVVEIG